MTDLHKAAKDLIYELGVYFDAYPHMQKGYVVDAIAALREALAAPVVPASFTDDDMKASWLTGFKEAEFQFRGCTEKSGEFPAKTPLSVAPRAAPPITTHPAPVVPEELTISTEHGPWKQSQYDEHETYCARCQVRDIFRTHRKCEPHIVAAAPKPKEQTT